MVGEVKVKVIAYYLPQFHQIKENDEWWEEGFTEWTNTKKMLPLHEGHNQPRTPLFDRYYDLMDKDNVKWQAELAKKYEIYGFCYYHYWFSGKKLLEKPAENLLRWKDIDKKILFCWANHSWYKSAKDVNKELLIEQTYGDESEWLEHFEYLKDFFLDERYIKIDNKPVLMLFDSKRVPNLDERLEFYDRKCKEIGFNGVYIIESINSKWSKSVSEFSQGVVFREPGICFSEETKIHAALNLLKKRFSNKARFYRYEKLVKESLAYTLKRVSDEKFYPKKKIFLGSFPDWDNTPRHGNKGHYILDSNPEKFETLLMKQKEIMKEYNLDFIFINAWNEWAEGMHLEPDTKFQFEYLEKIYNVFGREFN